MSDLPLLDRLGRRGKLTVTVEDGTFDVRLATRGPYGHRGSTTTDKADWWSHLRLGASDWHGEGTDLTSLLIECEEASRPQPRDIDELVFGIEYRRSTRTAGPPLPSYRRWHGWQPGQDRWLRTSGHAFEYLAGYLRDREEERKFEAEQRESEQRRRNRRQFATKVALQ